MRMKEKLLEITQEESIVRNLEEISKIARKLAKKLIITKKLTIL